jgi:multiple sugar transport system permease protein
MAAEETVFPSQSVTNSKSRPRSLKRQRLLGKTTALLLLAAGSLLIMLPLVWMLTTSLKTNDASTSYPPQWIPRDSIKATIDGKEYFMYNVPVEGKTMQLALIGKKSGKGIFVDPTNTSVQYEVPVKDTTRMTKIVLHWENFYNAMTTVPFNIYINNTMLIVILTMIGVLVSCILVAYGFSRFRARWIDVLFLILLSTIMLPPQVTLIPTFVYFQKLGWYNTFLPLIVPAFFANAWDVFLLRQFFMSIPMEMDEAAKIDGAGPLQVLVFILIPQTWPAIATVAIFHFLYTWNDFFSPLIYLQSEDKYTVAMGLQKFQGLYSRQLTSMMAAATVTMLPCLLLFFIAQRFFIQGVVVSGIKG